MTNGTDPWSVVMNTDPPEVPPEASDYMYTDVGRNRQGEYLDAQIPPYVQPPASTLNDPPMATLTSKPVEGTI